MAPTALEPEEGTAAREPASSSSSAPEEYVPADDAVIGRAFRTSLAVIALVAVLVAVAVWWVRRPQAPEAVGAIATAAPVAALVAAEAPPLPFTDVTREAGIAFVHVNGARGDKLLPETMGGGAAFFDVDGDGDPDLLFVNGTDWPHESPTEHAPALVLYENRGDGTFADATGTRVPRTRFYGMGVAVGDYDGDGWRDVFVTAVGRNHLFRNENGRLVEVTDRAGVGGAEDAWSTAATFLDIDGDGDLDLFVGNYVEWSKEIDFALDYRLTGIGRAYGPPLNYQGTYPYLYRNEGDGTFTEIAEEAGLHVDNPATGVPVAKTLAATPIDVDRDGAGDLFVANDTTRNFLFRNLGDGHFEEIGELYGVAYDRNGAATGAMGTDVGYYRNDDELGFVVGNFANEMTSVYVSQGDPTVFADEAITEGIGAPTRTALSFGVLLLDADLDGRLDLLQSNGHLEEAIDEVDPSQSYRQPAQLFWNAGPDAARGFVPVPEDRVGALASPIVGRGSATADIDADGDPDVVLVQVAGPPLLLRNDQATGHHWLRLRLVGKAPNRDALGALVELSAAGQRQRRIVTPTRSYLSQSELTLTFGLGAAESVDSLAVVWPDGTRQEVDVPRVDTLQVVEQQP